MVHFKYMISMLHIPYLHTLCAKESMVKEWKNNYCVGEIKSDRKVCEIKGGGEVERRNYCNNCNKPHYNCAANWSSA